MRSAKYRPCFIIAQLGPLRALSRAVASVTPKPWPGYLTGYLTGYLIG